MPEAQRTKLPAPKASAVTPRTVTAHLRNFRMSPRKMRLVAQTVIGMPAVAAVDYLKLLPKAAAVPMAKLVASAVANAGHNFQIAKEDLTVKEMLVNQGPSLKRFRPRAFGRAGMIRHRSSHVTVVLRERPGAVKKTTPAPVAAAAAEAPKTVTLDELKRGLGESEATGAGKTGAGETTKSKAGGFRRKMFQRKSG